MSESARFVTGHVYTFRRARNHNPKKDKQKRQGANSLPCTTAQVAGTALVTPPTATWAFPPVTLPALPNFFGSTVSFGLLLPSLPLPPPPPLLPPLLHPADATSRPCPSFADLLAAFPPTLSSSISCCCSAPVVDESFPINVSDGSLIVVCSASLSLSPVWMPGTGFW